MPLEFALRPRIDLERPAPKRRLGWLRLPPLALPIAAYWLGIAGATHALLERAHASSSAPVDPPPSHTLPIPDTSSPSAREDSAAPGPEDMAIPSAAPERDFEPAPAAAAPEEGLPVERPLEATERELAQATPRPAVLRETPPPAVRAELPAPVQPARSEPIEEPAPRRSELPKTPVLSEPSSGQAPAAGSLPSCESAAASSNETIDFGAARGAPDLTRDAFASVLDNGAYLGHCAIPARTAVEICAAVQHGKVVGVTVTTAPRDAAIHACVRRAVAALRFPRSARLDVTRTRFEPTP
jgi:hypothetical protein